MDNTTTTQEEPDYLTNRELGARIGVSTSMASRMRRGQRLPSVNTLQRCHQGLGIPYESLTDAYSQGADSFGALIQRHTRRR